MEEGVKMNEESMLTDKQYTGMLIDEFQRLERILKAAKNENTVETVKLINDEMKYLRLKLEPIKLPQSKSKSLLEIANIFIYTPLRKVIGYAPICPQ